MVSRRSQRRGLSREEPARGGLTRVLPAVILEPLTKRTAVSLPDDLYREIERARRRAKQDRSSWLQEAASAYLKKRTREEEEEAWLSSDERVPANSDELALERWKERHWGELFDDEPPQVRGPTRRKRA